MIYLDNNATTQPLPEVIEAMGACQRDGYANPSSVHQFGQTARHRVECAREEVARLIGASAKEIVFTGGGTESINLALRGGLAIHPDRRRIVTTAVEHSATLRVVEKLAREGYVVDYVGVDSQGRIDEAQWREKISDRTALASLLHVNNETGVIWDIGRLAAIAAEKGVPVHVDAVQSAGKLPIDVSALGVQLVSLAAHKFHGPKGVGALYVKRRTRIDPLIVGGTQERELRGGTENVEAIVGMSVAAAVALRDMAEVSARVESLRDAFEQGVTGATKAREPSLPPPLQRGDEGGLAFLSADQLRNGAIGVAAVNAHEAPRIHNTSNIGFTGLQSEAILLLLSEAGVCASAGAACSSGSLEPSHVLKAMNLDPAVAHGSIRFSFSRFNTMAEVEEVVRLLPGIVERLAAIAGK